MRHGEDGCDCGDIINSNDGALREFTSWLPPGTSNSGLFFAVRDHRRDDACTDVVVPSPATVTARDGTVDLLPVTS